MRARSVPSTGNQIVQIARTVEGFREGELAANGSHTPAPRRSEQDEESVPRRLPRSPTISGPPLLK
jgi:hypothetical protein